MYHFFVNQDQIQGDLVTVTGPDVNHIKNVLRMKCGEQILISNRVDKDYLCRILEIKTEAVTAAVLSVDEEGTELPARLYLFQGLPKGDKMELIIQKAVELGVYRIIPVETKRTVVKLDAKKEENRVRRWNTIAESAAKQSKRVIIPEVTGVMTLKEAFQHAGGLDFNLIPYEHAEGIEETRKAFKEVKAGMSAGLFIGPEGGFDDSEIRKAMEYKIRPVTLGRRILRTETAGFTILAALMLQLEK